MEGFQKVLAPRPKPTKITVQTSGLKELTSALSPSMEDSPMSPTSPKSPSLPKTQEEINYLMVTVIGKVSESEVPHEIKLYGEESIADIQRRCTTYEFGEPICEIPRARIVLLYNHPDNREDRYPRDLKFLMSMLKDGARHLLSLCTFSYRYPDIGVTLAYRSCLLA